MNDYWDNYIQEKFSKSPVHKRLHLKKLYKLYDTPNAVYSGYTINDLIVKVVVWMSDSKIYVGIGKHHTYDGADILTTYRLYTNTIDDDTLINILKKDFEWIIEDYFSFCE